jgi:hypothetical protein
MRTLAQWLRIAVSALLAAFVLAPSAASAQSSCVVGFDDPFALGNFFHQARGHFGAWSRWDATNNRVAPATTPAEAGSWFYRQRCGSSNKYVNVEPLSNFGNNDHLHLPFDNPALVVECTCTPSADWWMGDQAIGYGVCGSTVCPNWKNETRSGAYPHTLKDGVLFRTDNNGPFDMYDVVIGGSRNVWMLWHDGVQTQSAGPLAPGYNVVALSNVRWVQFLDWAFWLQGATAGGPIKLVDSYILAPGGQLNLASGRPATQSSTAFGGSASRAVDGTTNGQWSGNSVTHTNLEAAWWQVDLGKSYRVGRVSIFNRTDCCSERLSDFDVQVSQNGTSWTSVYVPGPVSSSINVEMGGVYGRYVRVKLRSANYLHLAEVRVRAAPPP